MEGRLLKPSSRVRRSNMLFTIRKEQRGVQRKDACPYSIPFLEEQPEGEARCDWDHLFANDPRRQSSFCFQIREKGAESGSSERWPRCLRLD
jgi:hypothetical protein